MSDVVTIDVGSKEWFDVLKAFEKRYAYKIHANFMCYYEELGMYYMQNDKTDYSLKSKRLKENKE
jgi:hypothetical protein